MEHIRPAFSGTQCKPRRLGFIIPLTGCGCYLTGIVILSFLPACLQNTEKISVSNPSQDAVATFPVKSSPPAKEETENKEVTEKMVHRFSLQEGWMPLDKDELKKTIEGFLSKVKQETVIKDKIRGLIAPHAGYRFSGQCAAYSYKAIKRQSYKRIFILGPNHYLHGFKGVSVTKFTHYETPLGEVPVDTETCQALLKHKFFHNEPKTEAGEHSVEIQIPFLQMVLNDFKIVPVVVGELTPVEMQSVAETIQAYVDENTLVVVSSDFMHYGERFDYTPFADPPAKAPRRAGNIRENIYKYDNEGIQYITALNIDSFLKYLERTKNTICGRKPIGLLMMILPDTQGTLLHYYTSGDLLQDFKESVSYASAVFADYQLTEIEKSTLLALARETLKSYLATGKKTTPGKDKITFSLGQSRGVFVTLKKQHRLRGCIGCIFDPEPLCQGVIDYTVSSAVEDRRFNPMTLAEEPEVKIEISVLSSLKRAKGSEDIVVGKHGVYLIKGNARAVFLPQVATEQGWDRETMLSELSMKAGLSEDEWKDKETIFYVFTAQVFGEKE